MGRRIYPELVHTKATEPSEHFSEDLDREDWILLSTKSEQISKWISVDQRREVNEVPGLGPPEDGEQLVDRKLHGTQQRQPILDLQREQPGIGREVDFRNFAAFLNCQPDEAQAFTDAMNLIAGHFEGFLRLRQQPLHIGTVKPEEVKIPSAPVNIASQNQCRAASEAKPIGRLQAGDDLGNAPLHRSQHRTMM